MSAELHDTTVGTLVAELGPAARVLSGTRKDLNRRVSSASVLGVGTPPSGGEVVLVSVYGSTGGIGDLLARLPSDTSRVIVLAHPAGQSAAAVRALASPHVIIEAPESDPAQVVLLFAAAQVLPDDAATRRLTALQRSLTQVLADEDPIAALLDRLKSTCNATTALVDKHGRAVRSTGPLPLDAIFRSVSHTAAETQPIDVDGWHGVADRIVDATVQADHVGWLVVIARRPDFPGAYDSAAVHVAAALVQASRRMTAVTRAQERAVRAAVLEEALALEPQPAAPELAGRLASLGLSWSEEMRAVVLRVERRRGPGRGKSTLLDVCDAVVRSLDDAALPHLLSTRRRFAVLLVQASPAALRRALVVAGDAVPGVLLGVGRRVESMGEVPRSFHDAQLAVQTLRRSGRSNGMMSYEDFDFATRLFSDVGFTRMTRWARDFLGPLLEREPLLDGLRKFFLYDQNMNAAAEALNIHHNSLRYRLAKVEELLEISLREPAAVSSVFLALTALDLEQVNAPELGTKGRSTTQRVDVEAPRTVRDATPPTPENLGVVFGPERR